MADLLGILRIKDSNGNWVSVPGLKGDTGEPFKILGIYATAADLEAAVTDPEYGDIYLVGTTGNYDIYLYLADGWHNTGRYMPKGDTGDPAPAASITSAVETWLAANVDPETGYVLDRSLSQENAAAPADLVGKCYEFQNLYHYHDSFGNDWTQNYSTGLDIAKTNQNTFELSGSRASGAYAYVLLTKDSSQKLSEISGFDPSNFTIPLVAGKKYAYKIERISGSSMSNHNVFFALARVIDNTPAVQSYIYTDEFTEDESIVIKHFIADSDAYAIFLRDRTATYSGTFKITIYEDISQRISDAENSIIVANEKIDEITEKVGTEDDLTNIVSFTDGRAVYYNSGDTASSTILSCSNFVPIEGYDKLRIALIVRPNNANTGLAFYSTNSVDGYISGIKNRVDSSLPLTSEIKEISIPENAKYFRTNWIMTTYSTYADNTFSCVAIKSGIIGDDTDEDVAVWDKYFGYGDSYKEKIKEFAALFQTDTDIETFMFFTDSHIIGADDWEATFRDCMLKMSAVYKSAPIDFCVFGGDIVTSISSYANNITPAQALYYTAYHDQMCRELFGTDRYLPMIGNHEYNYYNHEVEPLTDDDLINVMFRKEGSAFYAYDGNNTRLYVLNTGRNTQSGYGYRVPMNEYKWQQIDWLARDLIAKDPTHAIIAMHIIRNNDENQPEFSLFTNANALAAAYNNRQSITLNSITYDFSACTGRVEMFLGGHLHGDGYNLMKNGIPCIMRCSTMHGGVNPTFDIVFCDWTNRNVYFKKFGDGNDLIVPLDTYTPTDGTTEQPANGE